MKYRITIHFSNIDNSLYTHERASVTMDVEVTDERTLHILGDHLTKTFSGDHFTSERSE